MSALLQRLMLIAHAGGVTALLLLSNPASDQRWGHDPLSETDSLAEIITSPELHGRLPQV
ncbi:hypothetical protein C1752_02811 [Acaryochloris thomasi RCC1774]|uniref:Uncharacterized protein n=1 Tax=Acaryochloris thomasi RCC1774 TaxID=1764569 RepID=A0A2W1JQG5_9CYAN|nr:hypothetical protein [Acaryochloris thomasi]PZD73132.1 hypothetical protein C1752_02811 [Acaryochloris thomasi RCC1774]